MSERVAVTLKVEARIRDLMGACAKADRRTLSAYVETLIVEDAERKGFDEKEEICVYVKEKKGNQWVNRVDHTEKKHMELYDHV